LRKIVEADAATAASLATASSDLLHEMSLIERSLQLRQRLLELIEGASTVAGENAAPAASSFSVEGGGGGQGMHTAGIKGNGGASGRRKDAEDASSDDAADSSSWARDGKGKGWRGGERVGEGRWREREEREESERERERK
jgi:hypothetical protein